MGSSDVGVYNMGGNRRLRAKIWLPFELKRTLIQLCAALSPPNLNDGLQKE